MDEPNEAGRVPVSAPVRVEHRLSRTPDGPVRVVHRGQLAVYVDLGTPAFPRCVGVLASGAVAVPCGLRSGLADLSHLGERADVTGGRLRLGDATFVVGRLVDTRVPSIGAATTGSIGVVPIDVGALIGRGPGLTPEGDDVVCGWLAAHRAAGVPTPEVDELVLALLHRTTLLSATLLEAAVLGECLPQLAAWLRARGTASEPAARAGLGAVGASSGAALLAGAERALDDVAVAA